MASARKFICPIRQSLSALITSHSSKPHSRQFLHAKFEPFKALFKGVGPVLRTSTFHRKSNIQSNSLQKFCFSGNKVRFGSILGVSVLLGSISFLPNVAYAMDGLDILVNDHNLELLTASDVEEDRHVLWTFARKFWLPVFFVLTVLAHLDEPFTIMAFKLVLFLLSTKPSPFSVYVFVDELCHQFMRQDPHLYNKSLYARKVEVEDFKILCLARVEVRDQKFTLVGILGGWWPLPTSSWRHREENFNAPPKRWYANYHILLAL